MVGRIFPVQIQPVEAVGLEEGHGMVSEVLTTLSSGHHLGEGSRCQVPAYDSQHTDTDTGKNTKVALKRHALYSYVGIIFSYDNFLGHIYNQSFLHLVMSAAISLSEVLPSLQ